MAKPDGLLTKRSLVNTSRTLGHRVYSTSGMYDSGVEGSGTRVVGYWVPGGGGTGTPGTGYWVLIWPNMAKYGLIGLIMA